MKRLVQGMLLAVLVTLVTVAHAATPLPPRTNRAVYDEAGVIDPQHEEELETLARTLYEQTSSAVVVVTVPRLVDETIEDFAVRAGHEWGVGTARDDRGLVVAFAKEDRKIFVATGYGLEGILPDGRVGALIDEHAIPAFKEERFSEGIYRLTVALAEVTRAEAGGTPPPPAEKSRGRRSIVWTVLLGLGLLYLFIRHPGLFMLMLFSGLGRGRGGGGFGGGGGFEGFGGGGFGGGGAGRSF